jgi:hypothetical protein
MCVLQMFLKEIDLAVCLSLLNTLISINIFWKYILDGPSPHTFLEFLAACLVRSNIIGQYMYISPNSAQDLTPYFFNSLQHKQNKKILPVSADIWCWISRMNDGCLNPLFHVTVCVIQELCNSKILYQSFLGPNSI